MSPFEAMHEHIPTGEKGCARIEHFSVSQEESDVTKLRMMFSGEEMVPPGRYCKLMVNNYNMMSDTPSEQHTNRDFVRSAKGEVLVAGLGIGLVLVPLLKREDIISVTVIEKHREVIDLVGPHLKHEKLILIRGDIFTWKPRPGTLWDTIYFDIWSDCNVENLEEITKLKRRFGRRKNPGGRMGAWQEHHLRRLKREGRWR